MSEIHIEKEKLDELIALFAEAEAKVKEAEEIDGDIIIPSINELRYIGYHVLRSIAHIDEKSFESELAKAANHARRAIYDAAEAQVIFYLEKVQSFQIRHKHSASLTDVMGNYIELMHEVKSAQEEISLIRQKKLPVERAEYYQKCHPHIQKLKNIVSQLDVAELEIAKKEKHSARVFVITLAATFAGILGAAAAVIALII